MAKEIKQAKTEYDLHPLITNRWSPRAFQSDREVTEQQLMKLLDAARWAPSSFNEQPWRFIVGRKGEETYDKIFETLVEFNQQWAKNAPVLMIACGKTSFSKNGKKNRHFKYDTGAAMTTLAFQATADGIFLHQMAGFSTDRAREIFNIPEDYEPIAAAALGYKGSPDILDEKNKKSETTQRSRKSLNELVFKDNWNNPYIK